MAYFLCDIGGSWIKAISLDRVDPSGSPSVQGLAASEIRRLASPQTSGDLVSALATLAEDLGKNIPFRSAVFSVPGIVHASGRKILACADHLKFLRDPGWLDEIEVHLGCPATMINDADAFVLGASELGYVTRVGTMCCLVIGTGLGCAVVKDGRNWRPGRIPVLLGSIRTPGGTFDELASASGLAANDPDGDLARLLRSSAHEHIIDGYFTNLSRIILSAAILHQADRIVIGGGLCDAARLAGIDLKEKISADWEHLPPELERWPDLIIAREGNAVQLIGNAALAAGSVLTANIPERRCYDSLPTEQVHEDASSLHKLSPMQIINRLAAAEDEASEHLDACFQDLCAIVRHVRSQWQEGGRLIYVGAGTSGRLAAIDAVEIACTFGESRDRVPVVIAGGIPDALFSIENEGEEDYSSVPEMLLLQPTHRDTVIGISASGSSHFVRSSLAWSKSRGAKTALVTAAKQTRESFCDWMLSLGSGAEVVAGSTRMKAGTATKKILNFLSTAVLSGTGAVYGPYMINMQCLNSKLKQRAIRMLTRLFEISEQEARRTLEQNACHLREAVNQLAAGTSRAAAEFHPQSNR